MTTSSRFDWRFLAAGVVAASAILPSPLHNRIANWPSLCPFFNLTHLPCPFCGMTRSLVCCAHFQFDAAWHFHVLGPPLFAFLLLSSTRLLLDIAARHRGSAPLFARWKPNEKSRNALWRLIALSFFAVWVVRLIGWWPLPK